MPIRKSPLNANASEGKNYVQGDTLIHDVTWNDHQLTDFPAVNYLLRLHLESAEAFASTSN